MGMSLATAQRLHARDMLSCGLHAWCFLPRKLWGSKLPRHAKKTFVKSLLTGLSILLLCFWAQVDSELKDNVAKAYFSAVEADRIKASGGTISKNLKAFLKSPGDAESKMKFSTGRVDCCREVLLPTVVPLCQAPK